MSTLGPRGAELAKGPDIRSLFEKFGSSPYNVKDNTDGFVNIGTAENYVMLPDIADFVSKHPPSFMPRDFSYGEGPWSSKRLREGMARFLKRALRPVVEISSKDVLMTNGVTGLCEMLGFALGDAGDGILMGRPLYQAFVSDFGLRAKIEAVHVTFGDVDQFQPEAAACYEKALLEAEKAGTKVRALLLCNPHNPLGQCYPKETIIELMKLCNKHKIHLLSDEIYAMSVYQVGDEHAVPFGSVLSFNSSDYIDKDYLHVMYGMSKDFAAGGLRQGCLYTRNEELWKAISAISVFGWTGIGNERIVCQMLEDDAWLDSFFETSQKRLSELNELTRSLLEGKGIAYHRGGNAGLFLWIDLSPYLASFGKDEWEAEEALGMKFMEKKVFLTPGKMLNSEKPGQFRIIFSQEEDVVKEGLKRVFEVTGV